MKNVVALDIGNVLVHFDIFTFTKELAKIVGISDDEAYFFLERIQAMQDIGITTVQATLKDKFPKLDVLQQSYLINAWNSTISESNIMMNFLDELRFRGTRIAYLSNMGREHIAYMRKTYPKIFQDSIQYVSCEVGARKPTSLFFQSFCQEYNEFVGCVYVDDVEENLKTGKRYGFRTCKFDLSEFSKQPQSKQKLELDHIMNLIGDPGRATL